MFCSSTTPQASSHPGSVWISEVDGVHVVIFVVAHSFGQLVTRNATAYVFVSFASIGMKELVCLLIFVAFKVPPYFYEAKRVQFLCEYCTYLIIRRGYSLE